MPPKRTEQVRTEILTQCYVYRPGARDAERMARATRKEGELIDATEAEYAIEAAYLQGKGLVEEVPDALAQGHRRWKITAAGIDFLEARGLV